MKAAIEVLSGEQIRTVHDASLRVLQRTGMRFASQRVVERLRAAGAQVDRPAGVVRFPPQLVEEAIASNQRLLHQGRRMVLLNGVTSERTDGTSIRAKVSGGCHRYLDWETDEIREAEPEALLRFLRLGEMLPEVSFVGNPLVLSREQDGRPIDERLRRIRTAALIAKNTRKASRRSTSSWRSGSSLAGAAPPSSRTRVSSRPRRPSARCSWTRTQAISSSPWRPGSCPARSSRCP
jgi:trimethylamine:corrinoid methyltransferase-like protein